MESGPAAVKPPAGPARSPENGPLPQQRKRKRKPKEDAQSSRDWSWTNNMETEILMAAPGTGHRLREHCGPLSKQFRTQHNASVNEQEIRTRQAALRQEQKSLLKECGRPPAPFTRYPRHRSDAARDDDVPSDDEDPMDVEASRVSANDFEEVKFESAIPRVSQANERTTREARASTLDQLHQQHHPDLSISHDQFLAAALELAQRHKEECLATSDDESECSDRDHECSEVDDNKEEETKSL